MRVKIATALLVLMVVMYAESGLQKRAGAHKYKIRVFTGDKKGAGTDAKVYVTFFDKDGKSPEHRIDNIRNNFEKGMTDEFELQVGGLGILKKLRIRQDNSGSGPGWFLDKVTVEDLDQQRLYVFPCNKWLASDEDDGKISRDLYPAAHKYKITVLTGNKKNAGTNAKVYVTLFDKDGHSAEHRIDNIQNNFEKGMIDKFVIEVGNLGILKKLRIRQDNSGSGPGWFLDKVIVEDLDQKRLYEFPCDRWLASDKDDGKISRDLPSSVGEKDSNIIVG